MPKPVALAIVFIIVGGVAVLTSNLVQAKVTRA